MLVQDVELFVPDGGGEPGNLVWQAPRVIFILYLLGFWFVYIYIYCTIVLLSVCSPVTVSFWFHLIIFPFHIQHNYLHIFFS